jgi:pimeloyl-ACP methyl ester carboxylesterase
MKRPPVSGNDAAVTPRVRRGYFESRFGQLHVRNAMPPGGGFDEATALLCLHPNGRSARVFQRLLEIMGRDRSTYAPDLPGFGESDAPAERATIPDVAAGIADFIDSMRFRQIDVLGWQMGSAVAAELAAAKPQQVRRVVLIGVPLFTDAEREVSRRLTTSAAAEDGSHLVNDWRRMLESRESGVTLEALAQRFAEMLENAPAALQIASALAQYPLRERLTAMRQPVLVLRPRDELWDVTPRSRDVLPRARMLDLPACGSGLIETAPEAVANATREFLKG